MCGIVYVKRKDGVPAYKSVMKRYHSQKNRGQQGYGYVAIKNNKVVSYKRAPTEHEIVTLMQKEDAPEILFHHRFPTSTPNIEEAAHPLLVEHTSLSHQYFVAHNGVIRNDDNLKKIHNELGFKYMTEIINGYMSVQSGKMYSSGSKWNDSESIAIETALALDGKKKTIDSEGAAAIICIQTKGDQVTNRFFYRNASNPLKFREDKVMVSLTSEGDGEMVNPLIVQRLKEEGGYEDVKDMQTPNIHVYMGAYGRPRDFFEKNHWDAALSQYVPNESISILLPQRSSWSAPSRKGYSEYDDEDIYSHVQTMEQIIAQQEKDDEDAADTYSEMVSIMTDSVLHEEWTHAIDTETSLKRKIKLCDDQILENNSATSIERRANFEKTLEEVQEYIDELAGEITSRESIKA